MADRVPRLAVLGASGLIGSAIATSLMAQGFEVLAVARHFTRAQKAAYSEAAECELTELGAAGLASLLLERRIDIVVNCIGALQETAAATSRVDGQLIVDLLKALASSVPAGMLVYLSIPGRAADDGTLFSRSKREVETLIGAGSVPYVILRPGFVIAPNAYGGSALIRGLAALPLGLPKTLSDRPFAAIAMSDLAETIGFIAQRWAAGEKFAASWEVMEGRPGRVGDVVQLFRRHFGGPDEWFALPNWLLVFGTIAGDLAGKLGWSPPIRTTALAEMRRGIEGDPLPWMLATGIEPKSAQQALEVLPTGVQENWFGRLFLLKALIIGGFAAFWIVSGLVALTVGFDAATATLATTGLPASAARGLTVITSLVDIAIGVGISMRKTARGALVAGVAVALLYLVSATLLTPHLWIDPLGPLVKVGPAILLTLVALAILEGR